MRGSGTAALTWALVVVALLATAHSANEFRVLTGSCDTNGTCIRSPGYPSSFTGGKDAAGGPLVQLQVYKPGGAVTWGVNVSCTFAVDKDVGLLLNEELRRYQPYKNTLTLDPPDATAAIPLYRTTASSGDEIYWLPRTNGPNNGFELCAGDLHPPLCSCMHALLPIPCSSIHCK
jgi:hypothetical protein